jgi:HAD superfamily hydrolase (TIGR01548 family)
MDGVLVDVSASCRLSIKCTAEHLLGEEIDLEEIQSWKDRGGFNDDWMLTAALVRSRGKDVPFNRIVELFQRYYIGANYDGFIANETWLFDKEKLTTLSRHRPLGIVTGRPREEALHTLERQGVRKLFNTVITADDMPKKKKKPHPFGLELAVATLGAEDAFYFGDTVDDMVAARAAGITPVAVMPPELSTQERHRIFCKSGARIFISHVNHIMEAIDERS